MNRYNAATDDRPIWPRNPWPNIPRPLSNFYSEVILQGADDNQEDGSGPSQWSPFGLFQSIPYIKGAIGLGRTDPRTPDRATANSARRTDFYDASPNAWPNNGQYDHPNAYFAPLIRLKTHTSAHPGKSNPTGGGPTMYFKAPPVFSMQTKPIPAVGV